MTFLYLLTLFKCDLHELDIYSLLLLPNYTNSFEISIDLKTTKSFLELFFIAGNDSISTKLLYLKFDGLFMILSF